ADDSSISGSRAWINGCLQRCVGGLDLSLETVDLCPGLGDSLVALFHLDSRDQSFAKKIFESGIALSQRLQLFRIRRAHRLQARLVLFRRIDEVLPEPLTVSRASSFSGLLARRPAGFAGCSTWCRNRNTTRCCKREECQNNRDFLDQKRPTPLLAVIPFVLRATLVTMPSPLAEWPA